MYIIKNALKCIGRSKGRNVLIGIIVLVIAISACLGLSIGEAAENAKTEALASMSVSATISFDRNSMMNNMGGMEGGFNRDDFMQNMGGMQELTLEEYEKYAAAESVKDFYYLVSTSLDGNEELEPVTNESGDEESSSGGMPSFGGMGGFGGGKQPSFGANGEFTVVGYSGENAMTEFLNGTASITEGSVFAEGVIDLDCVISEELAIFNGISVGDSIILINPNNEEESYTLTVVGIYQNTESNTGNEFSMFGNSYSDPANKIYMSYNALAQIILESESVATTETDEQTGMTRSTAVMGNISATYLFASVEDYEVFTEEVRDLGLDESYTISSSDIASFENSLVPLNTLSQTASTFLIVILIIGGVVLVVLNIFNVRERKYEIGVLAAMGMKKRNVAAQFMAEIFVVTMIAVMIGVGVGAVGSVPVTNALLENQVTSSESRNEEVEFNFGRGEAPEGMPGGMGGNGGAPQGFGDRFGELVGFGGDTNYITEISSAMNFNVVLEMMGIAILLTLVAGSVSMLFIMRYEPLKILANRD